MSQPVVVVTRDEANATHSLALLAARGVCGVSVPLIAAQDLLDDEGITHLRAVLTSATWVLLTSANAVDVVARTLGGAALVAHKVAVVGPATASAAVAAGIGVTVEGTAGGAALGEALVPFGPSTAVFIGAEDARRDLIDALEASAWTVEVIGAYRTLERSVGVDVEALFDADVVTFASPSAVRAFAVLAEIHAPQRLPKLVAIGSTTEAALRDCGLLCAGTASAPTALALVEKAVAIARGGHA